MRHLFQVKMLLLSIFIDTLSGAIGLREGSAYYHPCVTYNRIAGNTGLEPVTEALTVPCSAN